MAAVVRIGLWFTMALALGIAPSLAADLVVRLKDAPANGSLVFQVYDSPNAFGDFRDPAREVALEARGDSEYSIGDLPAADIAVLVYVDENRNGLLDKSFIGIPTEALGISNGYRPKGPPNFEKASFRFDGVETTIIDIAIYRVLGERGRIGVGIGAIGRSSPYLDSSEQVLRVIPAITYNGKRLQWFGPNLRYGLLGSGQLRLALTASYRIGVFEEKDSLALVGLGDREDTLLAGLGLQYELAGGVDLAVGYEHDVLDRIGGGEATLELSKGFQAGGVRLVPQVSAHWSDRRLGSHDYGVPKSAELPGRPAYEVGSTVSYEIGVGGFAELTESWRLAASVAAEFLDSEVSRSPIVADDSLIKGFLGVVFVF